MTQNPVWLRMIGYAEESHVRSAVGNAKSKGMKKGGLQKLAQFSKGTITKMVKDKSVTIDVISRIVTALDMNSINDILEIEEERRRLFYRKDEN